MREIEDMDLPTHQKGETYVSGIMWASVHTDPDANLIINVVFVVNTGMVLTIAEELQTDMITMIRETGTEIVKIKGKISIMEEAQLDRL